jgi:hypothetical protein
LTPCITQQINEVTASVPAQFKGRKYFEHKYIGRAVKWLIERFKSMRMIKRIKMRIVRRNDCLELPEGPKGNIGH